LLLTALQGLRALQHVYNPKHMKTTKEESYYICDKCLKKVLEIDDVPHYRDGHDGEDLCQACYDKLI